MHDEHGHDRQSPTSTRNWVFAGFLLVAGFFLLTEHRAHLFGVLPYLFLLACPLMHFFGHGHGHSGHGHHHSDPESREAMKIDQPPGGSATGGL